MYYPPLFHLPTKQKQIYKTKKMSNPSFKYTSLLALLLLTSLSHSFPSKSKSKSKSRIEEEQIQQQQSMDDFVVRQGTQLLAGGQPLVVNGFNTYWLMCFAADPETKHKVAEVFREAADVGLNVCRTWAFNDGGWKALQVKPMEYDEDVFQALDFVVSEARNHNMRLLLSLCNNWEAYGGKAQYVKWGKDAGLELTCDDDFFSDATLKSYYKAFVEAVLSRVNTITNVTYKDDPTIMAWELINEPRCPSDPSGDTLQAWIEEMVAHVKSIDPVHLLEIGVEGYYGPSTPEKLQYNPNDYSGQVGADFIRNHQVSGIDIASVHIYSDAWLPETTTDEHLEFVQSWMEQHLQDAENLLGMPLIFGEFGVSLKDDRFTFEFRENFIETVYRILADSTKNGGVGGGCFLWQLFPDETDHMDDGYAIVLSRHQSTQQMLTHSCRKLRKSHLKGFKKYHGECVHSASDDSDIHEEL